jgi:hypothetical protein
MPLVPLVVSAMTTIPAAVPAGRADRETPRSAGWASPPPVANAGHDEGKKGFRNAEEPDSGAPPWPFAREKSGNSPQEPGEETQVDPLSRHQAFDACFADEAWVADIVKPGSSSPLAHVQPADGAWLPDRVERIGASPQIDSDATSSAVVLALVLGGFWGVHRAEALWRRGRRVRI